MVNILNAARRFADEIGGQFTDYDHTKAVVVVPLPDGRFQTVLAIARQNTAGKEQAVFTSKICEYDDSIDLKDLLERNLNFDYAKFIIEDEYLKIEASCISATASEEMVREMITEVANLADEYELKFTGEDVH